MAYINLPPDLRVLFSDLDRRLRLLETAGRFTFPIVTSDPSSPRKGDAWFNSTSMQAKIVDANGSVRIFTIV
jgi:proteasome lid subunit RPN8/RPN11